MEYLFLELKVPSPISVISETYNRAFNIFELVGMLPNGSLTASETVGDSY